MKFSSWLALGALFGRETCKGKRNWKDAALAAIIVNNEVLDKDGVVRKKIEQGTSDSEIQEDQDNLDREMGRRQARKPSIVSEKLDEIEEKRGFLGAFVRGFRS